MTRENVTFVYAGVMTQCGAILPPANIFTWLEIYIQLPGPAWILQAQILNLFNMLKFGL